MRLASKPRSYRACAAAFSLLLLGVVDGGPTEIADCSAPISISTARTPMSCSQDEEDDAALLQLRATPRAMSKPNASLGSQSDADVDLLNDTESEMLEDLIRSFGKQRLGYVGPQRRVGFRDGLIFDRLGMFAFDHSVRSVAIDIGAGTRPAPFDLDGDNSQVALLIEPNTGDLETLLEKDAITMQENQGCTLRWEPSCIQERYLIVPAAVSTKMGHADFSIPPDRRCGWLGGSTDRSQISGDLGSMYPGCFSASRTEQVPTITLASILERIPKRIDVKYVNIDAMGYDFQALASAGNQISRIEEVHFTVQDDSSPNFKQIKRTLVKSGLLTTARNGCRKLTGSSGLEKVINKQECIFCREPPCKGSAWGLGPTRVMGENPRVAVARTRSTLAALAAGGASDELAELMQKSDASFLLESSVQAVIGDAPEVAPIQEPHTDGVIQRLSDTIEWDGDVFDKVKHTRAQQISLFDNFNSGEWAVLLVTCAVLLLLDTFVFTRFIPEGPRSHVIMFVFWLSMGLLYNMYFWWEAGQNDGLDWMSGYFLEWLLSMDNLFVFHLIFKTFKTPAEMLHKALFVGIIGAVAFRIVFFLILGFLLHIVQWIRFVFGFFLIYSGFQALEDDGDDLDDMYSVKLLRACVGSRLKETYDHEGNGFFVTDNNGRTCMTMLVYVVLCLEVTDVIFAVDSVSAKLAQIPDQFIAYSSSVMAIFGLRAMFFIIKDLVDYFEMLKYGLCFILVFIGCELMVSNWIQLSSVTVTMVIFVVFATSIGASFARMKASQRALPCLGDRSLAGPSPETILFPSAADVKAPKATIVN
eukprot:gnl/TRDRNA2_/TRDRNA2_154000_c0_seq2.p1 gnl/TRDRNA2_/TRDRNA2_154000_c0~~gnl/TRDRNA2_/TRDRNA2_154000_c0_seq2.p1  ORF type:complete len:814 (+),score=122.25 gnl/TRDRNA2_/TRDRNA2_154000_c0_seq2:70-2511(+)